MKRYLKCFSRDQLLFVLHEDLKSDPVGTTQRVYSHLGVSATYVPDVSATHNPARVPKSLVAKTLATVYTAFPARIRGRLVPTSLRHVIRDNLLSNPPPLHPDVRYDLPTRVFARSITRLQPLIDRDLSQWISEP